MKPDGIQMFAAHYRQSDGKPQTVRSHLEEASAEASVFAGKIGLSSLGALAGLLHDIGKYSVTFQAYLKSAAGQPGFDSDEHHVDAKRMKGKIDHSSAGAQILWQTTLGSPLPVSSLARQMIALCVASHHSGLIDCLSPVGHDVFGKRMSKDTEPASQNDEERYLRERITDLTDSSLICDQLGRRMGRLKHVESSLQLAAFGLGLLTRFLFSALIDADRLSAADFEDETAALQRYRGDYQEWEILAEKLETHLAGLEVRNRVDQIRRGVSAACLDFAEHERGMYQLTVPTGGGKTLASLRFALHHAQAQTPRMDRIIYVAPFISIIDQNAGVVRSILEADLHADQLVVLEHHSNLTPERDTERSRVLTQNWDAPIVFTTAVQLLETLFGAGTRGVRRMHQLANAVIIFDEVQTLPINTIHLFNNAMNFLVDQCGSTVVFCTATQPLLDRVDSSKGAARLSTDSQMMPNVEEVFKDLRRVDVIDKRKDGGWTEDEVADAALQETADTGSALVVVNTKAHAREIYRQCREKTEHVFHLSTSMCPAHRMDHLDRIRKRLDMHDPKPVICISTQLIEAGIDVDFGSVIRSLAGLDSIAQAAGRCNRNDVRPTGRVLVVNSSGEKLDRLPDIRKAQEITQRVLDEFRDDPATFDNDLQSPKAMARYYHYYFFERAHEMAYPVSPSEAGRHDTLLSLLSTNEQAVDAYKRMHGVAPPMHIRQSFKTAAAAFRAIDSPTEGVIVPYGEGDRLIGELSAAVGLREKNELLRQAQRYSVSMFPYEIEQLHKKRRLHEVWEGSGVYWLDHSHYSEDFGASVERVGYMKTLAV